VGFRSSLPYPTKKQADDLDRCLLTRVSENCGNQEILFVVNTTLNRIRVLVAILFEGILLLGSLTLVRSLCLQFFYGIPSGGTFSRI
jgi:hypothetical protein